MFFTFVTKSISSSAQQCSCNPTQICFTSKFSYLILCNPTHKTETGIGNRCGTTNSEPAGPIVIKGQSETLNYINMFVINVMKSLSQNKWSSFM